MCGIAGQFNFEDKPVDQKLVRTMTRALSHRGPDGEGFYFDQHVGLGHRRLSIIDLETGRQPMRNEDGTIWLVSNGEIYNFVELREELKSKGHTFSTASDTEVILHLYEELGERCLEKLIGMFAFTIWDQKKRRLFLARDRFGIKPLHYFYDKDTFIFASEIKALLKYEGIDKTLNPSALDQYFTFLYVVDPNCIFKRIRKLPPAHYLICEHEKIYIKKYWDLEFPSNGKYSEAYYEDHLKTALEESIQVTLRSDVPVGVFLSGGIDSSVVAALAKKANKNIKTFSVVFEESIYSEEKYSRLVAKNLNTDHHELVVTRDDAFKAVPKIASFLDEPFADSSSIPTYYVSKLAKSFVKTVLTGEGGDELFAGYDWHTDRIFGKLDLKSLLTPPSKVIFGPRERRKLYSADLANEIKVDRFGDLDIDFKRLDELSVLNKFLYLELKTYLPSDMLVKLDRMSMMNSLEGRLPLLNHHYVEFVNKIPSNLKFKGSVRKYLFKKAFSNFVPKEIIRRRKRGFEIPLEIWLWQNGKFRDMVYNVVFDSKTKKRGYFNYKMIEKMFYEHDRLLKAHHHEIWTLFILELWHRNFLDE